ncbi:hypothetical protein ACF07T_39530 [Streptomyces sp. NPDC015184]|uniref:hypothetical protein n=1 Tax=Streptomyces sp. NPDC015184 TaxID=3364946 RepID=UPI0037009863
MFFVDPVETANPAARRHLNGGQRATPAGVARLASRAPGGSPAPSAHGRCGAAGRAS